MRRMSRSIALECRLAMVLSENVRRLYLTYEYAGTSGCRDSQTIYYIYIYYIYTIYRLYIHIYRRSQTAATKHTSGHCRGGCTRIKTQNGYKAKADIETRHQSQCHGGPVLLNHKPMADGVGCRVADPWVGYSVQIGVPVYSTGTALHGEVNDDYHTTGSRLRGFGLRQSYKV